MSAKQRCGFTHCGHSVTVQPALLAKSVAMLAWRCLSGLVRKLFVFLLLRDAHIPSLVVNSHATNPTSARATREDKRSSRLWSRRYPLHTSFTPKDNRRRIGREVQLNVCVCRTIAKLAITDSIHSRMVVSGTECVVIIV